MNHKKQGDSVKKKEIEEGGENYAAWGFERNHLKKNT